MRTLGELEARIMDVLWRDETPLTVREVHDVLERSGPIAYTTVMTVMDRLWRKKMLRRRSRGRAYLYWPAKTEAAYTAALMHELLGATRDRRGALAYFVRGMAKRDEAELRRLAEEGLGRRRRR